MFASAKNCKNRSQSDGSIILLAMVILVILGTFVGALTIRINTIAKNQASIERKKNLADWGRALAERIDCIRTMGSYSPSNICPESTPRTLTFLNEAPLSAVAPASSYPIGKNWYAQVTCGINDLRIKLARYENGKFDKDPLTGQLLDFSTLGSLISDGGYEIPMCPSYFGTGQPSVRVLGMSKATQQKLLVDYNISPSTGNIQFINHECDGVIGMVEGMDDTQLPGVFREGGAAAPSTAGRSTFVEWFYNIWRDSFNGWGQFGNMQSDWVFTSPRYIGPHLRGSCLQICIMHGMATGILTKCDASASSSNPPLGQTIWDDPSPQVNCLCIR